MAAALLVPAGAGAAWGQSPVVAPPAGECVLRLGPNGVIRGDQVPAGCVITSTTSRRAPDRDGAPAGAIFVGTSVVFVPVRVGGPRLFLPDPPFVGVPPGPGAAAGADSLPAVRPGSFGPIERPFGPVTQPFRPTNRSFGRTADAEARTSPPPSP